MYKASWVLLRTGKLLGGGHHSNGVERHVRISNSWVPDCPHEVGADDLFVRGHIRKIRASRRLSPLLFAGDADRPTSFLVHSRVFPAPGAKHLAALCGFQFTTSQWIIFESVAAGVEPFTAR